MSKKSNISLKYKEIGIIKGFEPTELHSKTLQSPSPLPEALPNQQRLRHIKDNIKTIECCFNCHQR